MCGIWCATLYYSGYDYVLQIYEVRYRTHLLIFIVVVYALSGCIVRTGGSIDTGGTAGVSMDTDGTVGGAAVSSAPNQMLLQVYSQRYVPLEEDDLGITLQL